jgi:cellulose synthase (UDP-forming)
VQELFYRSVQVARDKYDAAICVGSCAIYRRQALDAIGGTALIEHSEDVHTGFDLRRAGWGLRYVPIPLATGVCPERPDSFLTQQYRWCAGSMSLLASEKFWRTRLRFTSRLCYVSGFCYYVHTALFTFLTPVIPIVLIVVEPREVRIANYLLIIPSTLYNLVVFPLWNRCRYGFTALIARYLYGWAHVFAIADCLRGRRVGWQATGGVGAKASTARVWRAIAWWGGCTTIIWVVGSLVRARQFGLVNWSFILLTGLLYGAVIIAAVRERDPSGLSRVRGVIGPRQTGGEVTR